MAATRAWCHLSAREAVPQDNASAYMWLNLATANGYSFVVDMRDAVAHDLSQDALSRAQERARIGLESQHKTYDERTKPDTNPQSNHAPSAPITTAATRSMTGLACRARARMVGVVSVRATRVKNDSSSVSIDT